MLHLLDAKNKTRNEGCYTAIDGGFIKVMSSMTFYLCLFKDSLATRKLIQFPFLIMARLFFVYDFCFPVRAPLYIHARS